MAEDAGPGTPGHPFHSNPAATTPISMEAGPRPASGQRLPVRRTLFTGKTPSLPVERTLSHQGSSIHAEWCQLTTNDHVQLSVGDPPPLPPLLPADPERGGLQEKRAVAAALAPTAGAPSACCGATLTPSAEYLRLACWLALLFAGYGLQRGLCAAGLPYDCDTATAADAFTTLTLLAFVGGGLGWLAGVTRPARFAWLVAPRRAYLWIGYLVMFPAYSGVSTIPAMHESLASFGQWSAAAVAVIATAAAVVFAAIAFHIWLALYPTPDVRVARTGGGASCPSAEAPVTAPLEAGSPPRPPPDSPGGSSRSGSEAGASVSTAEGKLGAASSLGSSLDSKGSPGSERGRRWRRRRPAARPPARQRCFRTLGVYLLPRLAALLYFAAWFGALAGSGSFQLHLHHYALGWAVASLAAFNHPVSGMMLALATAVFVQGASSYGFDPFFSPSGNSTGGCLEVASPKTGQMTCAFWAQQPFNISFCSDTDWLPWFDCTVDWPWPATKITKKMLRSGLVNFSVPDPVTSLVPLVPLIIG